MQYGKNMINSNCNDCSSDNENEIVGIFILMIQYINFITNIGDTNNSHRRNPEMDINIKNKSYEKL